MITRFAVDDKEYIARARELFIRLSLLTILVVSCFLLLRPFLTLIVASLIIAIGAYPGYCMLSKMLSGRKNLSAVLCTLLLLLVVIVPALLLAGTLAGGLRTIGNELQAGQLALPPAPAMLEKLPVIGPRVLALWNSSSTKLSEVVSRLAPEIREHIPALLSASVGIAGVLLQFILAIFIAGFLLATSEANSNFADRLFARIFGEQGPEFKELVASTIRSVTNGILGVAVIQSLFASLGFWFMGLPGAGLWAVLFLIAAVLQVGALVFIPAVLYAFASYPASHAALFLVWCIVVGLMDNVLKPILLGRGSKVPMAVIFLGVLGGFVAMRIIGLFVGAVILSVGYKLFMAWLDAGVPKGIAAHANMTQAS